MRLEALLRGLSHRNFRLFFIGQGISLVGTWMQQIAMTWLVYDLTRSPFLLGLVGFVGPAPTFLITPFAGVFIDRWNRRRTLLVTQALAMLQALLLVGLTVSGRIEIWQIIALSVFFGVVNAVDMPARQAFLTEMVESREDLANAIALNSSLVNAARLVGPSVAGVLIALAGEWVCFLLNALSYLAVLAALAMMRVPARRPAARQADFLTDFREGFAYAFGFPPIRSILLLMSVTSLAAMSQSVLMPMFATDVLHGGPRTLGWLTAAAGIGALAGGLYMASRASVLGLGTRMTQATALLGIGFCVFAVSRSPWLSWLALSVTGFAMIVQMAASNTILQTIVDEPMRGRVMSFYIMAFMGVAPLGSLLGGILAGRIGAPYTVLASGVMCLGAAAVFAFRLPAIRALVRPIYVRAGILPEVAAGLNVASELTVPPER